MTEQDIMLQRLVPSRTLVLVVDVQERLAAAMPPLVYAGVLRKIEILLGAAAVLGAEVAATEQYPKGLGSTVAAMRPHLERCGATFDEKLTFSAAEVPGVTSRRASGTSSVIIAGMEAHVCVYQTVRDLVNRGLAVHVVSDAVISRNGHDCAVGLALCERAGAVVTTTETVIFDWLERAGSDAFRAVSKLLR